MPHVITRSCCGDGSCVYACPVNCIHPGPDEPGFATAEMLHIDPAACVDCAACVSACPVGAIVADSALLPEQRAFAAVNAAFYPERAPGSRLPPATTLAAVPPAPRVRRSRAPLTVAVVGSGPAGMYAADELLTQRGVRVNVFDRLPTPYGLVRGGVAPDHQDTRGITRLFDRISRTRGFRFYLNVEVGRHVSHDELQAHHHAVLYAAGASRGRGLDIPGSALPGCATAMQAVAWINGHPDLTDVAVELDHERVVVVGNGNVALDIARLLTADPESLARTDISTAALDVLGRSAVREVVVAARRGPAQSAFTLPQLIGLTATADVVIGAEDRASVVDELTRAPDRHTAMKLEILAALPIAEDPHTGSATRARVRLAYHLTPRRIIGDERVRAVEFQRAGDGRVCVLRAGLVLAAVGQRAGELPGLPFDAAAAVVPNRDGRVIDPATGRPVTGVYVAGWIKRGPSGFIGTNKSCAMQTVSALVDDFNTGILRDPVAPPAALDGLVRSRQPDLVDDAGWRAIDAAERARGQALGRPRVKFASRRDLLAVAGRRGVG